MSTDFLDLGGSKANYKGSFTFNLASDARLHKYNRPCSIGFMAISQNLSTWSEISIESSTMYVYNLANGLIERYDASTGT
jgi:hypothetical protein